MFKHPKWLICTALLVAVLPVNLVMAASASAAPARPAHLNASTRISAVQHRAMPMCITSATTRGAGVCCVVPSNCLRTVQGTAWPVGGVNIRTGPSSLDTRVNTMPQNSTGTVFCYTTGQNINGNSYWDQIVSSYGQGYVADYYFYTGGNINQQVDHC